MKRFAVSLALLLAFGCAGKKPAYTKKDLNEQLVMATLWVQQSAEYRALCYQAFNAAKAMLDKDLQENPTKKKRAVIVDGDESSIEAHLYEAYLIGRDLEYPEDWFNWVGSAEAGPLPGAVEFFNYAASKGVETFYVTNRKQFLEDRGTFENLKKLGFPDVDEKHLSYRRKGENDNKEGRRLEIAKDYHVVLLVGDNLDDFTDAFWEKSIEDRFAAADRLKKEFGSRFIVTPNPMYGTWEKAILNYKKNLSPQEKDRMRKGVLKQWERKVPPWANWGDAKPN
jgi:5'-nucleotidase (lipoprotein e(P4) family)